MIQQACTYVPDAPEKDSRVALIETIRTVSAGKIFVELERARLTRQLAEMKEAEGDSAKATELMHEVQVETIGSMDSKEKCEFLLEQVRSCESSVHFTEFRSNLPPPHRFGCASTKKISFVLR